MDACVFGTMMHIEDLPDSLLLEVFSYLSVWELIRISRVCLRWERVAGDLWLWKHVDLSDYVMGSGIMWHLLNHYLAPHLQSLHLRGYLFTGGPTQEVSLSLIQALGRECPNLWRLCLHVANLRYLPLCLLPSTLRALELHDCEIPDDWLNTEPGQHLPPLESLVLQRIPAFRDKQLQDLGRLPSLRSLVLVQTDFVDTHRRWYDYQKDIWQFPYSLSTDTVLGILVQQLTHLRSLCVTIEFLSGEGLEYLSTLLDLERLTLVGPVLFMHIPKPTELLTAFLAMPKLRTLEMVGMDWNGQEEAKEEAEEVLCKGLPHCKVIFTDSPDTRDSWI